MNAVLNLQGFDPEEPQEPPPFHGCEGAYFGGGEPGGGSYYYEAETD